MRSADKLTYDTDEEKAHLMAEVDRSLLEFLDATLGHPDLLRAFDPRQVDYLRLQARAMRWWIGEGHSAAGALPPGLRRGVRSPDRYRDLILLEWARVHGVDALEVSRAIRWNNQRLDGMSKPSN